MTKKEKEALLEYIEFGLLAICDQIEPHLDDPTKTLLVDAYLGFLLDLDDTMEMHVLLAETQNP